jgi:hypothetical protein
MNSCKPRIIHERSKIIPIPQKSPTNTKEGFSVNEYSLKQNFFDPSKSSPPNEFMLKLKLRMSHYNSFNSLDSLINE